MAAKPGASGAKRTSAKRTTAKSAKTGGSKSAGAKRSAGSKPAKAKRATSASAKSAGAKSAGAKKRPAAKPKRTRAAQSRRSAPAAGRSDKSVQAFREALDRSRAVLESNVTVPRDRLQEVVDDAVKRGRMTRSDANELVSNLVSRGRKATDDLIADLESLLGQARGRVGRVARDAADRPLAEADKLRRRAGVASSTPIAGFEQLTADQIKTRLTDLKPAELRKVRTQEKRGKGRKSILDAIEKRLAK